MVSAQAAQMTDSFAARPKVTGGNAVFIGDSTSAGIEPGETAGMHGGERDHTVWAEWVAPDNGWVTFDSLGTSIKNPMVITQAQGSAFSVHVWTQAAGLRLFSRPRLCYWPMGRNHHRLATLNPEPGTSAT